MEQCDLCQNKDKPAAPNTDKPEENPCWKLRGVFSREIYFPTNASRGVVLTCENFAHTPHISRVSRIMKKGRGQ